MKRYVFLFFMSMLLFVLQTTLFHQFSLGNIEPNLILILTAISGFMYGRKMGMFTGVLCGLMMDLLYSNVIGLSILLFAVIGYLNGMVTKFYYKEEIFVPMISIGVSDVMYGILFYITNYLLRGRLDFLHYFSEIIIPEAIYSIFWGFIISRLIHWVDKRLYPVKAKKPYTATASKPTLLS